MPKVDATDRALIRETRVGMPVVARPYADLAERLNVHEDEVIGRLLRMKESGILKRIGVGPNFAALGANAFGMTVWDVADQHLERLAPWVAALDFVSLYRSCSRCLPQWRFNLIAMTRGESREDVLQKARRIAQILGAASRASEILFAKSEGKPANIENRLRAGEGL